MKAKKAIVMACAAALALPLFAGHRGHHRGYGRTAGGLFLAGGILNAAAATANLVNSATYGRPNVVVAPAVAAPVATVPVVTAPVVTAPVVATPAAATYTTGYYPAATTTTIYTGTVYPPSFYAPRYRGYHYYGPGFRAAPFGPPPRFHRGFRGFRR